MFAEMAAACLCKLRFRVPEHAVAQLCKTLELPDHCRAAMPLLLLPSWKAHRHGAICASACNLAARVSCFLHIME